MEKIRRSILMGGKTLLLGFALLVIALAATGCEQPDKGPVAVDSITISSELQTTDIVFEEGRTFKLTADIQPDNATDKTVVWSSDDESVATVSDDGTVTIKGVGNVTITAKAGNVSDSIQFIFHDEIPVAVSSITISSELQTTDIVFEEGRTFKLTADIQPDNATDKTVVWSSDDESVATVSDDGTVTIKGVGNVTITAEAGGKSVSDTFVFYEEEDLGFYFNETENTYYIWDERGLLAWNAHVMQYTGTADTPDYPNLDTSAKLMADISLEGISWTPVGYYDDSTLKEYSYAGTFDGGGHIISNLKIDSSDSNYLGLFAYIATGGVVENLTLSDVAISGYEYIGGIAGYNRGTIENCSVSGSVSGTYAVGGIVGKNNEIIENCSLVEGSISGDSAVGGIAGENYGTIENCIVSGSVSGTYTVGGIVGGNGGTISACNNKGKVSGTEAEYVGGIAGYSSGKITACYNTGEVLGYTGVGGIVGYNEGGRKISACYNTGNVLGFKNIGGIAGENYGTIENCIVSGSISGSSYYVGGIVGYNGGTISGCNNKGKVSGSSSCVGGIVGYNIGTISACYNIGEISGTDLVGGIAGRNDYGLSEGIIISCYNTGSISGDSAVGGIAGNNTRTITACYWSVPEGSSINYDGIGSGSTSETVKKVGSNGVTWEAATSAMNDAISDWNKENSNKCDYQFVQNAGESEPPVLEKGAPETI